MSAEKKNEKTVGLVKSEFTPKAGEFDITKRVEVTTTDKAPFHDKDLKISVSPQVAKKMIAKGWAKGKVDENV